MPRRRTLGRRKQGIDHEMVGEHFSKLFSKLRETRAVSFDVTGVAARVQLHLTLIYHHTC